MRRHNRSSLLGGDVAHGLVAGDRPRRWRGRRRLRQEHVQPDSAEEEARTDDERDDRLAAVLAENPDGFGVDVGEHGRVARMAEGEHAEHGAGDGWGEDVGQLDERLSLQERRCGEAPSERVKDVERERADTATARRERQRSNGQRGGEHRPAASCSPHNVLP